jgi:hypothetical protein
LCLSDLQHVRSTSLIRSGFCYAKQKNVPTAKAAPEGAGDIWTWVGLDADTKLAASFYVGGRDGDAALVFMDDLHPELPQRYGRNPLGLHIQS